jgi:hypothetical protein
MGGPWRIRESFAVLSNTHQKHPFPILRNAKVGGVTDPEFRAVSKCFGVIEEFLPKVGPAGTRRQCFNILHQEYIRAGDPDDIEKLEDMRAPLIERIHLSRHREPLTRGATNYDIDVSRTRHGGIIDFTN